MKDIEESKIESQNLILNFNFLKELLGKFKVHFIVLALVSVAWALGSVLRAYSIKLIIDSLVSNGASEALLLPVLLHLGSWIGVESFMRVRDYVIMYLKPYLKKHIILVFSRRMLKYDDNYFQKNHSSSLINALRNLYDGIDDGIYLVEELFTHLILIFSALISMYIINIYFSFIAFAWVFLWGILAYFWSKNGHVLAFLIHEARTKLAFHLGDLFSNTSITKTFNAIEYENEATENAAELVAKIEYKREKMFLKIWIIQGILFITIFIGMFYNLFIQFKKGNVTIGDFAMLIEMMTNMYLYIFDLAKDMSELSEATGRIAQGMDVVYKDLAIVDEKIKKVLKVSKGDIVFDKVYYKYPDNEEHALCSKQTITIKGGTTVALVGASGSGKSTYMKMLLRLIDPSEGKVLIDGQDINLCDANSVRKHFALVPQEVGLFQRSIKENIKYGSFDKTDEEVIKASKKAQIHDFIMSLQYGYDTIYGAQTGLSGGQKQRIMIARGLLRKAKIFLFDESTSALDAKTEFDVLKNIKEVTKDCTKIIIAHRLSTVKNADLILVCDKGEIVEQGNHEELLAKQGFYYSLMQLV